MYEEEFDWKYCHIDEYDADEYDHSCLDYDDCEDCPYYYEDDDD